MKISVAGVLIDPVTKQQALDRIAEMLKAEKPHLITTVYSEFIVFAKNDSKYLTVLNSSDLSLADGVGIIWADYFLNLNTGKFKPKIIYCLLKSLFEIVLRPKKVFYNFPEKISGSQIIWDIARLAELNQKSICLYGGDNDVCKKTAEILKTKHPKLKINLALSGQSFDEIAVNKINASKSDILLIAYSPPAQEIWLSENLQKLGVLVAIGLGGTFDYIAGKRLYRPNFFNSRGLEWLWRLITQPFRIKRIYNATFRFIYLIYQEKIKLVNYYE